MKTTLENLVERKRELDLYLASKGLEYSDEAPKLKGNGWFFWSMTILTCGGWWVVFSNFRPSMNQDLTFKFIDEMLETKEFEEHQAQLKTVKTQVKHKGVK